MYINTNTSLLVRECTCVDDNSSSTISRLLSVPIGNKPKKGTGIFGNGIAELRVFFITFQYFVDFFVHRFQKVTNFYLIGIIQQKLS